MIELYGKLLAELTANTTKAQNTDLFASDFQPSRDDSVCRITIAATAARAVRLVPSTGTGTAFYINGGAALTANAVHVEDVPLDTGRTWNIQTDNASGITTTILRVQELSLVT